MKKYYEAYDDRYRAIHGKGHTWFGSDRTPIVEETARKYGVIKSTPVLETGCGEGRDAAYMLDRGYDLTATDVSAEAVSYCKKKYPEYENRFRTLDCVNGEDGGKYGYIYSVAVIHMLVPDEDRAKFYRFIKEHLTENGIALICSMGDGVTEKATDINEAFEIREREHASGAVKVAATSFRMVSLPVFEKEIKAGGLVIKESGIVDGTSDYFSLMYAVAAKPSD